MRYKIQIARSNANFLHYNDKTISSGCPNRKTTYRTFRRVGEQSQRKHSITKLRLVIIKPKNRTLKKPVYFNRGATTTKNNRRHSDGLSKVTGGPP